MPSTLQNEIRFAWRTVSVVVLSLCVQSIGLTTVLADESAKRDFFESKIRPVLIEHCYSCHSDKSKEIKGGLRLDNAVSVLKGGDSGPSVIAGKPDASPLVEALRYDGLEMPPSGRLPNIVIQDFEKWVADGAFDPRNGPATDLPPARTIDIDEGRRFWAFQPIKDHPVPVMGGTESQSEIDKFIEAGLNASKLSAVGRADRATLIRRLYFDLTGLPPSATDLLNAVEGLSGDKFEASFESLVDRLLASPQFGVQWGRHWLDVARYADSNGGDFNATFHDAWKYRDYVVDSMNNDKPYDQFVREQIAGDLLPYDCDEQRSQQLIATSFLMIGTKMLSERDKEKLTMDVVDEQLSTVGSAFLGMTLGCARCHDHKFDPIPTRDYYALAGIFRSTRTLEGESQKYVSTWKRTQLPVEPERIAASKQWDARKKKLAAELAKAKKKLAEVEKRTKPDSRLIVDDSVAHKIGSWTSSALTPPFVGKGYIHDNRTGKGEKSVEFSWAPPKDGLYEVRLSYSSGSTRANNVPVSIQHADGKSDVTVDQTKRPKLPGAFAAFGRFPFSKGSSAKVMISNTGTRGFVIVDAVQFVEVNDNSEIVERPGEGPDPELATLQQKIAALEAQAKKHNSTKPPALPQAIAAVDLPEVVDCELCIRGEHKNRGARIPRGFLQVVSLPEQSKVSNTQSGRRELADWIVSPNNPLTARVIVNRVWHYLLGRGIVSSVDNFGQLGSRPTHPKLLDHLSTRFITPVHQKTKLGASGFGYSLKRLVKEIVLSDAWQRATTHDKTSWQADPNNKFLWKAHRRRIPAEGLRDSILAISEQLELSPGGSPVEGFGTLVKNNQPDAEEFTLKESLHRSLYLPIIRNELPPILTVFDFADPDLVVGQRPVTNVPAQALFLMNSPFVMNAAERTAKRLAHSESKSIQSLIEETYQTILSRQPTTVEIQQALSFMQLVDGETTVADVSKSVTAENQSKTVADRLARLIHVLFASTEFRMLN